VKHGGERAFYRPADDIIQMPERERFLGTETSTPTEAYYGTLLHELTHWTGAKKRCDREFGKRFGDQAYAMEELVAELGAAFLCADLGISVTPRQDHAAYIDNWLSVLKADKKAIFTAASKAAQASDYLAGLQDRGNTEAAA
jgi:antirestriction protein ArdC